MKDEQNSRDKGMQELLRRAQVPAGGENSTPDTKGPKSSEPKQTKKKTDASLAAEADSSAMDDSAEKAFKRLTDWDDNESVNVSLRTIIGGDVLAGRWFRRHLTFLLFLVFLAILYVTNRYAYQKEMIDNRKLTLALEDRRLRAVVATSNLTEYTRRSNISEQLPDTTLRSSSKPFYYIQSK